MKTCICLGFLLLFALPLHAETYSWVDDGGTYNYIEDYSKVPKKYRKKVKRRDELQQDVKPQTSAVPESQPRPKQADKTDAKTTAVPGDGKEMYGGKTRAAWRKEMEVQEAELSGIEQRMEQLRKQMYDPKGNSAVKLDELKKDYDDSRAMYDQKYRSYTELIETVRKAGITVDIKK